MCMKNIHVKATKPKKKKKKKKQVFGMTKSWFCYRESVLVCNIRLSGKEARRFYFHKMWNKVQSKTAENKAKRREGRMIVASRLATALLKHITALRFFLLRCSRLSRCLTQNVAKIGLAFNDL